MRTPRGGISGRATSICLGIGARSDRTDDVTIAMKPQPEPSAQEVLAGLVERVTYHNAENGFCVLRAKARGHRDVVTVVGHSATITHFTNSFGAQRFQNAPSMDASIKSLSKIDVFYGRVHFSEILKFSSTKGNWMPFQTSLAGLMVNEAVLWGGP